MKEIGGFLECELFNGKEYYEDSIAFNTATNALKYIILAKHITKIYIPFYLCDSVSLMLAREKIAFDYYHIDANFMPIFDTHLNNDEFLYVVNYYGQIDEKTITKMKLSFKNIIVDNVQAFFEKPIVGIDTIYSCRKFFGVPDGSYVYTNSVLNADIEIDNTSCERVRHLFGRIDKNAHDYYSVFKQNEDYLKSAPLRKMSKTTHNFLKKIDYQTAKKTREENYSALDKKLRTLNGLSFRFPVGPYVYPFYCKNGLKVRKSLAKKGIYIPILWPNVLDIGNETERDYTENILPVPCDQRYCKKDMEFLAQAIIDEIISK